MRSREADHIQVKWCKPRVILDKWTRNVPQFADYIMKAYPAYKAQIGPLYLYADKAKHKLSH